MPLLYAKGGGGGAHAHIMKAPQAFRISKRVLGVPPQEMEYDTIITK